MLTLDGRKENPYHCDVCGDSKDPCEHWSKEEKNILINWVKAVVQDPNKSEVIFMTWYEYEQSRVNLPLTWYSTAYHGDTLEDLIKKPPEREGYQFRIVRKTLTTEVM